MCDVDSVEVLFLLTCLIPVCDASGDYYLESSDTKYAWLATASTSAGNRFIQKKIPRSVLDESRLRTTTFPSLATPIYIPNLVGSFA